MNDIKSYNVMTNNNEIIIIYYFLMKPYYTFQRTKKLN